MDCPYLRRETTGFRPVSLDLTEPAQLIVSHTWYCAHPFHGLRVELGDALLNVEQLCSACVLPHERPEEDPSG